MSSLHIHSETKKPGAEPPAVAFPATRLQHVNRRPSLKARVTVFVMRRTLAGRMAYLADPQKLGNLRRSFKRADKYMGFILGSPVPFYRWSRQKMGGIRVRDIRLGQPVDRHAAEKTGPVLLYLHGGGFVFRTLNSHMRLAARIARAAGIPHAVLPVYRLAPEYPFPAGMLDCVAVYRALLEQGVAASKIVFAGDSAGGGLVLSSLLYCREQGLPLPACAIMMSPVTDLTHSGESFHGNALLDPLFNKVPAGEMSYYIGGMASSDPGLSPLFADFCGLPPMLVQVGGTERLLDDSLRLAERAEAAGCELHIDVYKNMPHVWQVMNLPEASQAIARIGRFVKDKFGPATMRL